MKLAAMTNTKPTAWNCVSPATVKSTPAQITSTMPSSAQLGASMRRQKANLHHPHRHTRSSPPLSPHTHVSRLPRTLQELGLPKEFGLTVRLRPGA